MKFKSILLGIFLLGIVSALIFSFGVLTKSPSHQRNWKPEYKILPSVEIDGDRATVRNIRNFSYASDGEISATGYYDRAFDLKKIESAWYGISHFAGHGLAHTFLSFGFEGDLYLTISVEARQEVGESYHPLTGLFRNYELAYVLADERDIIGLRSHVRKERVYLYRLEIQPGTAGKVLRKMLAVANEIHETPKFYNTLFDNCTTNLVMHAENVSFWERLFDYRIVLPGYSDELAYEKKLVRTDIPFSELRESSMLDWKAVGIDDPEFSKKIRR